MRRFALLLLLLLQAGTALGSVVVVRTWPNNLIGVTKDITTNWQLNDYACFRHVIQPGRRQLRRERVACGQVVRVTRKGLIVSITGSDETIKVGQQWEMEKVTDTVYKASGFVDVTIIDPRDPIDQRSLSLGVNYLQPNLHFEQGITRNFSVGFLVSYLSSDAGNGHINGVSYNITASYYSRRLYDGFWVQLSPGWYLFHASNNVVTERKTSVVGYATVGWKFLIDLRGTSGGINIGIAGGVQYYTSHDTLKFDLGWNGILPLALLQVGWKF